jgi:maltose phosphorylase
MAKVADQYLLVHPWKIIEDGFHPDRSEISESLFSLGNEHQGVRGYFDEGYSGQSLIGCYLNGIFEERFVQEPLSYKGISDRLCFMVNTVNWLHVRISLDGETLDLAKNRFFGFRRELDFRSGELRRELIWETVTGKQIKLIFSRLLSMVTKEQAFQRIDLMPLNFSGKVQIETGLDFSLLHRMYNENYWTCPRKTTAASQYSILGVSKNIGHRLFAGATVRADAVERKPLEDEKFIGESLVLDLQRGQESVIEKTVVLCTDRNPSQPLEVAWAHGLKDLEAAGKLSYTEVFNQNVAAWQKFWDHNDIVIDGDPDTQQGIRFCIFQMQQTYRGLVKGSNIGAKGLTGDVYNGNAFWDTETYCLPFYLFSSPQAAKALIDYRYQTLPQALERAKQLDGAGACFPVATIDGTESCTLWQHASLQFQSSTAIAFAIRHYVNITGDVDFLYNEGVELLVQISRFLASRGQWSQATGKFGFFGVMGPDEFHMMVNNNFYTNYLAKRTLEYTLSALAEIRRKDPIKCAGLVSRLECTSAEMDDWLHISEEMYLPFDPATKIYEQHDGFFRLPHLDVDSIPTQDFPLYNHWSYERIYRYDMIKQPDVLMAMFLFNQSFTAEEKLANYRYYEPRCIHESSLSPSVHSILASELGLYVEAFEFFRFATRIDLDNYNRNSGEGIHTTSIAAAWMNIVYGFGGMRSDGEMLSFNPSIPQHWKGYSFQVVYRGALLRLELSQAGGRVRVVEGDPVTVKFKGIPMEVGLEWKPIAVNKESPVPVGQKA